MNEPNRGFAEPSKDFRATNGPTDRPLTNEYDAADWEPDEDRTDDTLDALNHDPPEKAFVPRRAYEPTPFGTVEHEVRRGLDPSEQRAIGDAERRPRDLADVFNDLRSIDEVPGAGAEYEEHVRREEAWHDDSERRIRERFNRMRERSPDREP